MEACPQLTHDYFKDYPSLNWGHRSLAEWKALSKTDLFDDYELFPLDHPLRDEEKADEWIKKYFAWGCKGIESNPQRVQILSTLSVLKNTFPNLPNQNLYSCNKCGVLQHIPVNTETTCWADNQVCGGYPHWTSVKKMFSDEKFI